MPECHKCPYAGTDRCLTCRFTDNLTNKGQCFVSLDAGGAQTLGEVQAALSSAAREDQEEDFEIDERSFAAGEKQGALRLLQYLLEMEPAEVSLLLMALVHPLASVSRAAGLEASTVSHRWRALVRKHPELEEVIHPNGAGLRPGHGVNAAKSTKPYRGGAR